MNPWIWGNAEYQCGKCGWAIKARSGIAQEAFRMHLLDHEIEEFFEEEKYR